MNATLGIWAEGISPGISTIDSVAEDVDQSNLALRNTHTEIDPDAQAYAVINSKGFGGNNASATLLSPAVTRRMLQARYSGSEWKAWEKANAAVCEQQQAYDDGVIAGTEKPVYKFDHQVLGGGDVVLADHEIAIGKHKISLDLKSPYEDMKPG